MLTADDDYFRSNRESFPLPIQKQLSKKRLTFRYSFVAFLYCTLNIEHFERNEPPRLRRDYLNG